MKTIYLHHYYIPKQAFGCTYLTNFHEEFDNADHEGVEAILETYNRLYDHVPIGVMKLQKIPKIVKQSNIHLPI